ncbi:hypothetical protein IDAT_06145 [Pseudidiomarina atlantica]|jgi:hypothetical protein|uniref:Thermostable hemolysin n=1 Tax=Pseudidiomarina atlantica TaxID=1517416 RepID=A0A094ISI8_9GAMM|nr:thermostable hemolysin [Pseudidiomarina atlantica]KFZ28784.1 hypothetical protein IDAT_06145 [Pseudidiomarina atlantica]
MLYQLVTKQHQQRQTVEKFICDRYWTSFHACLLTLPEHLLAVYQDDELIAACGLQFADERQLFSEYYLSRPLEQHHLNGMRFPERRNVVEIGSMAARNGDDLHPLFAAVVEIASQLNKTLVVFTATRYLQRTLARSGVTLMPLADAQESALPLDLQGIWGDYYRHHPKVVCGWLAQGFGRFTATTEAVAC